MLTFEMPLVRLRIGNQVEFVEPRELKATKRITPMARSLALGYRIVQAVESGEIDSFREVARQMGVSHTRVSVLAALTQLSPRIQEAILQGSDDQLGFHTLLRIARMESWKDQEAMAKAEIHRQRLWGENSRMGDMQSESDQGSRPKPSQRGHASCERASTIPIKRSMDQRNAGPRMAVSP